MLLRLSKGTTAADVEALFALATELGYEPGFLNEGKTVLELRPVSRPAGEPRRGHAADRTRFEELACVASVLDGSDAPELAERLPGQADTVVRAGDAAFGKKRVSIIAGPCAVEDEARLVEIAHAVKSAGATLLRGGAFKPRTSPHAFQGLGRAGLEALRAARAEVGIGVVTEVLDPREVGAVADVADMLQIGSRSMTNATLLQEVGRSGLPVLLKRGFGSTVREFLLAAEYVLATGNEQVVLCERGVRGFDRVTRNVLDVGAVAHLERATHLPVIVDPSHAAGRPDLVAPLALAGLAAGALGLIVEVHPERSEAHSDGAQAITPAAFEALVHDVGLLLALSGRRLVLPKAPASSPVSSEPAAKGSASVAGHALLAKESTP